MVLTARDTELLAIVMQHCVPPEGLKVDYDQLVKYGGFKNRAVASTVWGQLKNKLKKGAASSSNATGGNGTSPAQSPATANGFLPVNGNGHNNGKGSAEPATPNKKRARKPKDPDAPPSKRGRKPKGAAEDKAEAEHETSPPADEGSYFEDAMVKTEHGVDEEVLKG